jgi:hypothetical protein
MDAPAKRSRCAGRVLHNGNVCSGSPQTVRLLLTVGIPVLALHHFGIYGVRCWLSGQTRSVLLIERDLVALGGIASTAELRARGHDAELILVWARYGTIVRVRKGWYAARDEPPQVLMALRVGGRLACISAAALHVSVGGHSSRLRTARSARLRLAEHPEPTTVVHWSRRELGGDRRAVSSSEALRQMRTCDHDEVAAAIREMAANR